MVRSVRVERLFDGFAGAFLGSKWLFYGFHWAFIGLLSGGLSFVLFVKMGSFGVFFIFGAILRLIAGREKGFSTWCEREYGESLHPLSLCIGAWACLWSFADSKGKKC